MECCNRSSLAVQKGLSPRNPQLKLGRNVKAIKN